MLFQRLLLEVSHHCWGDILGIEEHEHGVSCRLLLEVSHHCWGDIMGIENTIMACHVANLSLMAPTHAALFLGPKWSHNTQCLMLYQDGVAYSHLWPVMSMYPLFT